MNESNAVNAVLELIRELFRALVSFVTRHTLPLVGAAVVVLIVWVSWTAFRSYRTHKVTFLTGTLNGASADEARAIKEYIENDASSVVSASYVINLEYTDGYEENRKRVREDDEGQVFGFAYDGFGDPDNVAIVLPLDTRYLHILCRKGYFEDLTYRRHYPFIFVLEPTLDEVFKGLGRGRVAIGKKGSATRQCAKIVLEHFGVNPEQVQSYGVSSPDDIRAALNAGHIDIAFSSTVFPSSNIRSVAADDNTMLIGLGDHRDAILQENPSLVSVDFQKNAYLSGDFCRDKLKSIGARRVIICSDSMPEEAAYAFSAGAAKALRKKFPTIEWETMPPRVEQTSPTPLRYAVHPGAERIKNNEGAPGQGQWWMAVLATVGLWVVAEVATGLRSIVRGRRGDVEPADEGEAEGREPDAEAPTPEDGAEEETADTEPKRSKALEEELSELVQSIQSADNERSYSSMRKKYLALERKIAAARRDGVIDKDGTEVLWKGLGEAFAALAEKMPKADQPVATEEADKT